jgi:hypothetical protein
MPCSRRCLTNSFWYRDTARPGFPKSEWGCFFNLVKYSSYTFDNVKTRSLKLLGFIKLINDSEIEGDQS